MRVGMRVLFAVLGLFPLLAPYQLLIRTSWEHYLHPLFFFAALIATGAVAVSALFIFAAIAGLSSSMVLDRRTETFRYSSQAPIIRRRSLVHSLSDVRGVEVGLYDWSDGAPSYHLKVTLGDATVIKSGSSWSREDIESIRSVVDGFLAASDR